MRALEEPSLDDDDDDVVDAVTAVVRRVGIESFLARDALRAKRKEVGGGECFSPPLITLSERRGFVVPRSTSTIRPGPRLDSRPRLSTFRNATLSDMRSVSCAFP